MRIRLSEFRKVIQKFISEAMQEMQAEDVDRLNRAKDGYGETEFEEDVDRLRRAKDGYGETEFEESAGMQSCSQETEAASVGPKNPTAAPQSASSSASLHTRDKSQMKGVGPRPTMANAFGDQKKEAAPPPSAPQPTRPRIKDKSQMQGVGPRPTMATAFGDQSQQKKEDDQSDPNKTAVLTPGQRPDSERAERVFMAGQKAKKLAADREEIQQISHQQQAGMQKDGWKFDRHPSGNWSATPPNKKEALAFAESRKIKKKK